MMLLAIQEIAIGEYLPLSHMHLSGKSAGPQPVYNSNHVHTQNNCTIKRYWESGP